MILKSISQSDVKYIMILLIQTIISALNVSTDIITSIRARPIRFTVILANMSVSTFTTAVIIYLSSDKPDMKKYSCFYVQLWDSIMMSPKETLNKHTMNIDVMFQMNFSSHLA